MLYSIAHNPTTHRDVIDVMRWMVTSRLLIPTINSETIIEKTINYVFFFFFKKLIKILLLIFLFIYYEFLIWIFCEYVYEIYNS